MAKEPLQDIHTYFAIFTDSAPDNNGYTYAFVAVDIFSKLCRAVPVKDKKPQESIRAMNEVLKRPEFQKSYTMIMKVHGVVHNLSY